MPTKLPPSIAQGISMSAAAVQKRTRGGDFRNHGISIGGAAKQQNAIVGTLPVTSAPPSAPSSASFGSLSVISSASATASANGASFASNNVSLISPTQKLAANTAA